MGHTEELARNLLATDYAVIGKELQARLDRDQHDLFHDGEFADGCVICDNERKENS
jgi:hypothetical protein